MNKKHYLLSIMLLVVLCTTLSAATITRDEARQKAQQFLTQRHAGNAASRSLKQAPLKLAGNTVGNATTDADELYIFNVGQQEGFVIVSGDDNTAEPILGYADQGAIDSDNMPDNLRAWLQGYADQIRWMREHGVSNGKGAESRQARIVKKSIAPLLATQWNQYAPYNNYCPWLTETGSQIAVTGCVATATAQLMYYQAKKNNIASTTTSADIPSYESTKYYLYINNTKTTTVPAKPVRTFDWTKMTDQPTGNEDSSEEVARLFEYIGAGVQMQYGTESSASNEAVATMLTTYFGYDADIKSVYRDNYIYSDWTNLIYNELSTNGPVLFGGQSVGGGHAFLLDGYDGEDYFHVNWGWGGQSDGFYRLSALTPSEQGAGGSSTSDGFNYDQVVMVNVKPQDDGVSEYEFRLTVTDLHCTTKEYVRYPNSNFGIMNGNVLEQGVVLNYAVSNATGKTQDFYYGYALYQDGAIVQPLISGKYENMAVGRSGYLTLQFGNGIPDGEYRIISVCREADSNEWHPSIDSDKFYVKATISDNTMTLENIADTKTPELSATLELDGNAYVGQTTTIKAKITNTGGLYIGTTQLLLYKNETYYKLSYKQLDVEGGDTDKEFDFTFKPNETGTWNLVLLDKNNNKIGETSINVTEPTATTGTLKANNDNITIDNGFGNTYYGSTYQEGFYGSTLTGHITVTNTSTTNDHTSGMTVKIWQYNGKDYTYLRKQEYATNVAKNDGSQTIDFQFKSLTVGTKYLVTFHYVSGNTEYQFLQTSSLENKYGITTIADDGTEGAIALESTIDTPEDALVLDISQVDGVISITPNSNPNTLYIVSGNAPTGLEGKNVVVNGTAASLTLSDGNAFYSPTNFTATEVSYTRTFEHGADGANGWYTIMLPFDVTSITCTKNGVKKELHWFTSDESSGDFWLKTFSSEEGTTVNFGYASSFEANTPYIIAVPGNTWGDAWDLRNIEITFHGNAAGIGVTAPASVSGDNYKFTGSTMTQSVSDSYMLTDGGKDFIKGSGDVAPFRAYFKPSGAASGAASRLFIGSERPTAITPNIALPTRPAGKYYNLNGQRVAQPRKGLYIVDGRKVIVK